MNSIETLEKQLHDKTAMVERKIQSRNQLVEVLTVRLEGLKRAAQLLNSEHAAIAESLQANRDANTRPATMLAAQGQKSVPNPRAIPLRRQLRRHTQISRGKTATGSSVSAISQKGALTRLDMIAAVLGAIAVEASAN
jgi:hypothetical protein